jgi:uncharacterized membrane-anchored protein YitT (DUF2179 family)
LRLQILSIGILSIIVLMSFLRSCSKIPLMTVLLLTRAAMMLCASFTLSKHVSEKDSPKPFLVHNLINSIIAYAVLMINIQLFKENLSPSTEAYEGYRKKEKKKNKIEHKRANKYSEKQIRDIAAQQDKLPGQKRTKIVSDFRYP